MRTRPLALAFVVSAITSASLVFACSPKNSVESQTPGPSSSEASTATGPSSAATTEPSGTASSTQLAACKDLPLEKVASDLPDGGMTMTNASPKGDAGVSDRLAPVQAVIKSAYERFRCCFDAGGKHARGTETKLMIVLDLNPKGELRSAKLDPDKSDKVEPAVEECMVAVAKGLTYPESGDGMDTAFRYTFPFRGRQ
ncbi:MAG: hypothetical protein U0414_42310 [Polyangiaceae bacterium]